MAGGLQFSNPKNDILERYKIWCPNLANFDEIWPPFLIENCGVGVGQSSH